MSNDNLIRLLTIFDSSEETEALTNALRNSGHIVRNIRVEDEEDMHTAIEENPLDIILLKSNMPNFDAQQALNTLIKSGRDLPLIVITPAQEKSTPLDLLQTGARDIVAIDQHEHFRHVIKREFNDLISRRTLLQYEQMLHQAEHRVQNLIDRSRDAIAYIHEGMHIYVNAAYLKMFGYKDQSDVESMPILDMVNSSDHAKFKGFLRSYNKDKSKGNTLEVYSKNIKGEKSRIVMEFFSASLEGEECTQIIIRDQTLSKKLENKLHVLSKQDLLTGLYNRTYFLEQLDKLLQQVVEGEDQGALLYIALDNHESIKEEYGISGSDQLLTDIASLLKKKLTDVGILARFTGHIFTLLLQNSDNKKIEKIAGGICKLVKGHHSEINDKSIATTVSIGIVTVDQTVSTSHTCITRVERACLSAQQSGGNTHQLFNLTAEELSENDQLNYWSAQIKSALKNNQFQLMFQPIVSLHGEPGEHYEVLVRMLNDKNEVIPPINFMPAAENSGLLAYIDRWVIANIFIILMEHQKRQSRTRFFVKLSSGSLSDKSFIPWIEERIKAARIEPDNLVFELSEDVALNFLSQAKKITGELKKLRFKTALENFGLEENVFGSLKQLDVNYVKIHGDIIKDLANNVGIQDRVKLITEKTSRMNKQTIAPFVENANSLAVLWQCNVDFIQGYFLRSPGKNLSYNFKESF